MENILEQVITKMEAAPHNGQSLLLYALMMALNTSRGGHMFMLQKLRDMDDETRKLAYGLMDLMVRGGNQGEDWNSVIARMEKALRGE